MIESNWPWNECSCSLQLLCDRAVKFPCYSCSSHYLYKYRSVWTWSGKYCVSLNSCCPSCCLSSAGSGCSAQLRPVAAAAATTTTTMTTTPTATARFIRSQKKNAQLVFGDYIYNKKLTQANGLTTWRCADMIRARCKAICVTKASRLVSSKRSHTHESHRNKILERKLYPTEEESIAAEITPAGTVEKLRIIKSPLTQEADVNVEGWIS